VIRRLLALTHARNLEFVRDRASLGWNLLLPLLLVAGLALIFSGPPRPLYKVGVYAPSGAAHPFLGTRYVEFVPVADPAPAMRKVTHHRLDMLLDLSAPTARYVVNTESPKGYVLERMLIASGAPAVRVTVSGAPIRYIDFLLPGILGMNMMFSCLFGVGYVVVRYRKNGFLKRLHATPVRAIEFVAAQVGSRLLLVMAITVAVYVGTDRFVHFRMEGSYLLLALVGTLGAASLVALGFLVAARATSEELAGGLLNLITWPMMLLSGVWFSLEGSAPWLRAAAQVFPMTHVLDAARAIMLDGAGFAAVAPQIGALTAMTAAFLALGALSFRWRV
jgi:ABC-2 type transport system permease protein